MRQECNLELKARITRLVNTVLQCGVSQLIDCKKYSTLTKLKSVTARVLRKFKSWGNICSDALTMTHISKAELLWVKDTQHSITQNNDFERQKRHFKDEKGVWRCKGRLSNVEVSYAVKNLILVPRSHTLTILIVGQAVSFMMESKRPWPRSGKSSGFTEWEVWPCVICRKLEGLSFKTLEPPPLPVFRQKDSAFTYTGVEIAGPVFVHGSDEIVQKAWICLFTCYITRAVHLKGTSDQSTATFLCCLEQFSGRRLPTNFMSDNGKTCKAASKYIQEWYSLEISHQFKSWIDIQCWTHPMVGWCIWEAGEINETLLMQVHWQSSTLLRWTCDHSCRNRMCY